MTSAVEMIFFKIKYIINVFFLKRHLKKHGEWSWCVWGKGRKEGRREGGREIEVYSVLGGCYSNPSQPHELFLLDFSIKVAHYGPGFIRFLFYKVFPS